MGVLYNSFDKLEAGMCCVPHLKTSDQGSRTCKALASGLPGELRPHLKPLGLGV